jgi:hypothetical protein
MPNITEPITAADAESAARDIVRRLVRRWQDAGLPNSAVAEALVEAGFVHLVQARGPAAAASVLQRLLSELGTPARIVRQEAIRRTGTVA